MNPKVRKGIVVLVVGIVIWFLPVPGGLKPEAWQLFAIFVATILGFILQPIPIGGIAFSALTVAALTKLLTPAQALASFGTTTIWLIVSAFLFARGFLKTGLGRRIAFLLMKGIGDSTLKLGYAFAFSDLIMSPTTPSATARVGGVIYPVARALCTAFQSEPGPSARRMGTYLMQTVYQCDNICCAMFLTSMAANPLVASLAQKILHVELTWPKWALATSVPGVLTLLVIPYIMLKLSPPEVMKTPEAALIAQAELEKMGPMSYQEKLISVVFIVCLALWCTGSFTNVDATVVAMLGLSTMVVAQVIEWKDVIEEKGAWDCLIWMGSIIAMADGLNRLGFIPWFAKSVSNSLAGLGWALALVLMILVYFYAHYGFASMTAHVTAMFAPFISVGAAAGAPPMLLALTLGFLSPLGGGLTHFSGGAAPIYFGAGYTTQGEWWRNGLIISVGNLLVFVALGVVWWKIVGLW